MPKPQPHQRGQETGDRGGVRGMGGGYLGLCELAGGKVGGTGVEAAAGEPVEQHDEVGHLENGSQRIATADQRGEDEEEKATAA